jgi:hypothetical protein
VIGPTSRGDNYTAGASVGGQSLQTIELAPTQCSAGTVAFSVLPTQTPAFILLTDTGLEEVGRWSAT